MEFRMKEHFPIFHSQPELVFLDNASTTQKPQMVVDCEREFYERQNANIHRGFYALSANATQRYEAVRKQVADFIGAASANEIAFTKGATESINIVANSFSDQLRPGDNVVVTAMEHHANFIPWQQLCNRTGAEFRVVPITSNGDLDLSVLESLLDTQTKILAITHISNVLGTINPIKEIVELAHKKNIPVLVDAAQSAGHIPVHVKSLNVDFLSFSAHKMFGPMGVGVLYAKAEHHAKLGPLNFGGGIVKSVRVEETEFLEFPQCVEAGTPNVAGVLALGSALEFLATFDSNQTFEQGQQLAQEFKQQVELYKVAHVVGNPAQAASIVSFTVGDIHPHDVAAFLAEHNIAVRAGHHCAQPLLDALGIPATVRVSFSIYNTMDDVRVIVQALRELKSTSTDKRINQLYHDIIKRHDQNPYHFKRINDGCLTVQANNPTCGDKFDLTFHMEGDTIRDIHFHGFGCAVSKASTSVLAKSLEGQTTVNAQKVVSIFLALLDKDKPIIGNAPDEFAAFHAVRQFPERYDCAALAWLEAQKFLTDRAGQS
jgi:cysteine desulfurase / selenocysteine lyase